jgi:hypothetical protein
MIAADKLTPEGAMLAARELVATSHGVLVRKGDVPGMSVVRGVFDTLHALGLSVPTGAEIDRYSHAIGPFVVIADGLSPAELLAAIAHECEHVRQFWEGEYAKGQTIGATLNGGAAFAWLYLVEPEARVRFEARAYRTTLEVLHMLGAPLPSINELTDALARGYMLDAAHVQFGRELLESALLSVRGGVYTTTSGVRIEAILKRHGVL